MHALRIYQQPLPSFDGVQARSPNKDCKACPLAAPAGQACAQPVGEPGGLLVVGAWPARTGGTASAIPAALRAGLKEDWKGPLAFDVALRCPAGAKAAPVDKMRTHLGACATYAPEALRRVDPQRIIVLGRHAAQALLGRSHPALKLRRGWGWMTLPTGRDVPVFQLPEWSGTNKLLQAAFLDDLRWAMRFDTSAAVPPSPDDRGAVVRIVETVEEAQQAAAEAKAARWAAVDAEWVGRPYDNDHRMLSVSFTPGPVKAGDWHAPETRTAWVFPFAALQRPEIVKVLKAYLRDPLAKKCGSYIKADMQAFQSAWGAWTRGVVLDVRLANRLLDPEVAGDLETMAERVGRGAHKSELDAALTRGVLDLKLAAQKAAKKGATQLAFGGRADTYELPPSALPSHAEKLLAGAEPKRYGFAFVPPDLLSRYNAADTVATAQVGAEVEGRLAQAPEGMRKLFRRQVMPASNTYARIESWGIKADRQALQNLSDYLAMQLDMVGQRLAPYGYDVAKGPTGSEFNPNAPAQVAALVYGKLGLKRPGAKARDDDGSTDADALDSLRGQHPVIEDLLLWRKYSKAKGNYADGLLEHIRDDGRIHPSIHPDGARTGRTSSSAPNLQNLSSTEAVDPIAADLARRIRSAFVAEPGWTLIEYDYSQIELRIAADLSGDPAMLQIFKDGVDYHLRTAQLLSRVVWGIAPEEVTAEHRREIKPVNFALLYDDDPYGIAFRLGIPVERAEALRDAVFGCFPVLAKWVRERIAESKRTGLAWTWWDGGPARARPLWGIGEGDQRDSRYKTARRGAWNAPIQGTANEYLVASAVQVVDWIVDNGIPARVLATVHDSMLCEVRNDTIDEFDAEVVRIMGAHRTKNGVPLVCDAKYGPNWADMEKRKKAA